MLYLVSWNLGPETRDEAIRRFKETGGAPPDGVKLLGRWHAISGNTGVTLAESDDPVAIGRWCHAWTDLLEMDATPVVDDEGVMAIFG
jgi:hypothetical protein